MLSASTELRYRARMFRKTVQKLFVNAACGLVVSGVIFSDLSLPVAVANADDTKGSAVLDMVLASVDGEPLTMSDLREYISSRGEVVPQDLLDGSPEVRKYLRDMIVDQLVAREAESANISVSEDEVAAYIEEISRQNNVDADGFTDLLRSRGISLESYKKQVRSDIVRTRIVGARVRPKINILDEDIKAYLAEHPDLQPKSGEVHVEQILLRYPEGADEEAVAQVKERADELRSQADDGKELSALAKDDYTDLGFVTPSDLRPVLADAITDLKPPETALAIEPGTGVYVLKLAAVHGNDEVDEDVKQQIRKQLFEERIKGAVEKFFNDELPKKYHVELKL